MKNLYPILFTILLLFPLITEAQIITTWAGGGYRGSFSDPGPGCFDKFGNFYLTDILGCKIYKIDTFCNFTTIAGTGTSGYNGDSIPATSAQVNQPIQIIFDSSSNLYFSDASNHRVRRIDHVTGIITTIAGNGTGGYNGENIPATFAQLYPTSICFDKQGNLYIAEPSGHRVRKVNTAGIISTFAGNGIDTCTVNGGRADTSSILEPRGICFDSSGNLYVSAGWKPYIFKVNPLGNIFIVAGIGLSGYNGDNIPALTAKIDPDIIAVDGQGNMFFDDYNNRIRMIDTSGIIHTVAGNGTATYTGDNGPADSSGVDNPGGVTFDHCGNLYISQVGGQARIRKVALNPGCSDTSCGPHPNIVSNFLADTKLQVYPIPATNTINVSSTNKIKSIAIVNLLGQTLYKREYGEEKVEIDISSFACGVYVVVVEYGDGRKDVVRMVKE